MPSTLMHTHTNASCDVLAFFFWQFVSLEMWRKTVFVLVSSETSQFYNDINRAIYVLTLYGCVSVISLPPPLFPVCVCVCVYFTALPNLSTDSRPTNENFSRRLNFICPDIRNKFKFNSQSRVFLFAAHQLGCFFFALSATRLPHHIARHSALCVDCISICVNSLCVRHE